MFLLPAHLVYTGCFKKRFTTLKAYRNLYRGHTQRFELSKCSKTHRVLPRDSYGSMWLPLVMRQTAAVAKVTPEILRSVWQETDYRWDVCPHYQWKSHWTITIRGKTRCVLLHFDSSKRFVCPLYKFLYAFKVVKLFLKHPVLLLRRCFLCGCKDVHRCYVCNCWRTYNFRS